MYPLARLARVVAHASVRRRLGPLDPSVISFRVGPLDIDTNGHLNNGRYLTLMDLGRWDMLVRNGLFRHVVKNRWAPVVADATMRYRASLRLGERFDLETRMASWDERDFYIEHTFRNESGALAASGAIRGTFLERGERVPTQRVVDAIAPGTPSPPPPKWIAAWSASRTTDNPKQP